jgi:hypothetical protein
MFDERIGPEVRYRYDGIRDTIVSVLCVGVALLGRLLPGDGATPAAILELHVAREMSQLDTA